jgi:hypothetical protein
MSQNTTNKKSSCTVHLNAHLNWTMNNPPDNQDTPYAARQAQRNDQYRREYAAWIKGLSAEEQKAVRARGLGAPYIDPQGVGAPELDLDRVADKSFTHDYNFDESPEDGPGTPVELEALIDRKTARKVRRIIIEIMEAKNARLTTECLALVTGVGFLGDSETAIAKKYNLTRAAVSKRCVELCEKLGLPPARAMKSEAARESYRASRHAVVDRDNGVETMAREAQP